MTQTTLFNTAPMMSTKTHAKLVRDRALAKYQTIPELNAGRAAVPESNRLLSKGGLPVKPSPVKKEDSPLLDTPANGEFHFNDSRFHEVIILKRCPWCNQKPYVHTLAQGPSFIIRFLVVHRDTECKFGPIDYSNSMRKAINLWNFAVNLATK